MEWFHKNRRYWRTAFLILLVLAISGPWAFDLIHVPSQYICSPPNIRLNGDFCGMPFSVIGHFTIILFPIIGSISTGLFTGEVSPGNFLVTFFLPFLPLLPFLTTLFLIPGRDWRRWHILHLVVLGLVAALSLFYGLASLLRPHASLRVWGVWLYFGLAASMLLLEIDVWRKQGIHV
ncbi:MAG: hypothetical protein KJ069_23435 [Anaerolineae bacterium]|nr:hypothetical protein [Anaerolineae bacterium]